MDFLARNRNGIEVARLWFGAVDDNRAGYVLWDVRLQHWWLNLKINKKEHVCWTVLIFRKSRPPESCCWVYFRKAQLIACAYQILKTPKDDCKSKVRTMFDCGDNWNENSATVVVCLRTHIELWLNTEVTLSCKSRIDTKSMPMQATWKRPVLCLQGNLMRLLSRSSSSLFYNSDIVQ